MRHVCIEGGVILHVMTNFNTFKSVWGSPATTCNLNAHFLPLFTFLPTLWIGRTVFCAISRDFLLQKAGPSLYGSGPLSFPGIMKEERRRSSLHRPDNTILVITSECLSAVLIFASGHCSHRMWRCDISQRFEISPAPTGRRHTTCQVTCVDSDLGLCFYRGAASSLRVFDLWQNRCSPVPAWLTAAALRQVQV